MTVLDKTQVLYNLTTLLTYSVSLSAHLSKGAQTRADVLLRSPRPGEMCSIGCCRDSDALSAIGRYLGKVEHASGSVEHLLVLESGEVHSWGNCTIHWIPETAEDLRAVFRSFLA